MPHPAHLVQILLPLADNQGNPFPDDKLERIKDTLVQKFGGVTAFTHSPAQGLWAPAHGPEASDDVVVIEVMTAALDEPWWAQFHRGLEKELQQDELVIRSHEIRRL